MRNCNGARLPVPVAVLCTLVPGCHSLPSLMNQLPGSSFSFKFELMKSCKAYSCVAMHCPIILDKSQNDCNFPVGQYLYTLIFNRYQSICHCRTFALQCDMRNVMQRMDCTDLNMTQYSSSGPRSSWALHVQASTTIHHTLDVTPIGCRASSSAGLQSCRQQTPCKKIHTPQ